MQATSHATVAAPIETVWGIVSDHVGMSTWGPGGITVTMDKAGTEEANGVGAVRRITTPGPGPAIVEEVVTYQRPHVFAYKALSGKPFPGYAAEVRLTTRARGPASATPSPPQPRSRWSRRRWRCSARCCCACLFAL